MCVHRESTAQRAVKVLRKSHMDEEEKRMLFNEINILKEIVSNNSELKLGLKFGATRKICLTTKHSHRFEVSIPLRWKF